MSSYVLHYKTFMSYICMIPCNIIYDSCFVWCLICTILPLKSCFLWLFHHYVSYLDIIYAYLFVITFKIHTTIYNPRKKIHWDNPSCHYLHIHFSVFMVCGAQFVTGSKMSHLLNPYAGYGISRFRVAVSFWAKTKLRDETFWGCTDFRFLS